MYVYELPFNVNKELCRLLDNDDDWKELAGVHMKYSPFDINEIEQDSRRRATSPTNELLIRWGQQNHRVEELMILLYYMRHVPAMRCIVPLVDKRFQQLLKKASAQKEHDTAPVDENSNQHNNYKPARSDSSLPLPVMLIEKGVQLASSSKGFVGSIRSDESTTDAPTTEEDEKSKTKQINDEILKNVSAIPMLSYEDLTLATNNWSEDNLLGRGGFGQVFKGEWKFLPIAVKRLKEHDGNNNELIRELCLNQYRHDNILPLYGYSLGGKEACLVYQLMLGGSLEQRLRCKTHHPPLTWCQRYRIAHGAASGLQYLHTMEGTPLIHGDIKPANILLDQCSIPKIGDFGLARKGPYGSDKTHLKVSRIHGTRPYLPEEYLRGGCLSPAVDVFSFGVLIVEMASNLHAVDRKRKQILLSDYVRTLASSNVDFATLEDPKLQLSPHSNPNLCREFIDLGARCTALDRQQRPTMLEVYRRLNSLQLIGPTSDQYAQM